jgi:hypothetical protein
VYDSVELSLAEMKKPVVVWLVFVIFPLSIPDFEPRLIPCGRLPEPSDQVTLSLELAFVVKVNE